MRLDGGDDFIRESGGHSVVVPKVPSFIPAAGAAGDLGDLGCGQAARAVAVELAEAGESDVVDVHVQAHADRVGGDQEVDPRVPGRGRPGRFGVRGDRRPHDDGAVRPLRRLISSASA